MSECVVRMEMPLNCFECPMYDWNRQKLCCNAHLDLRPIPNGGAPKPDWCPVICELPEGHGRPGDLDELKNWLVAQIEHYKRFDYGAICSTMVSAYETVCKVIDSMTAIGPTEAESPSPKPTDPLPIRGVEYVPTEVDVQTGTVTYEPRERRKTCLD